jgi:hypothetical protein
MLLGHSTSMNSINSLKEEDLNLLEEEIAKQFAEAANAAKKADRVSCISCFRDRTNSNLPADKQVPSTPGNERKSNLIYPTKDGKEKNGRKGIDETVGEAYKKELENARQEAQNSLCKCCKKVEIWVKSVDAAGRRWIEQNATTNDLRISDKDKGLRAAVIDCTIMP